MPDWVWLIALFLMLTIGYLLGFMCGTWKEISEINACPSENAYIKEAELMQQEHIKIETRKAELEFQFRLEQLKAIKSSDAEELRRLRFIQKEKRKTCVEDENGK